ncbi:alpha/beta fold hydrolase [Acinetobacter calcoaceticus]|uniref:alpha/beta fold hydrolase n=1 Tax=Acinetobacter calcoaceticus TaxID=471 RepID=UPI00190175C5|nr:alpha/beta fold hydrolase [Acinetobacter calcoaceticus]MBJ9721689.1 alpha/beta fold hydrolase [Acinetobacter calcoaceticus]
MIMQPKVHTVTTSDQQTLCVKTWGDEKNTPLVLVHGYPDNQEVWESVIEYLINDFYIVTYDVRGAGLSSIPKRIRDYRLERLSLDLQEVVDQLLPNRQFHMAAHDWGSIQSWESATEPKLKGRLLSYTTISGPCLDHAALFLRDKFKSAPSHVLKILTKSWYIGAFHLPILAPTVWSLFSPEKWGKILTQLERQSNLPLNNNINADGKYGINLYRANFIPRLTSPRQRYAQCPVKAIILKYDAFVSPEYITEAMPKWVEKFEYVELEANHWAILSKAEQVASHIRQFINAQT